MVATRKIHLYGRYFKETPAYSGMLSSKRESLSEFKYVKMCIRDRRTRGERERVGKRERERVRERGRIVLQAVYNGALSNKTS